jgi:hypothetical protein
MKNIILPVIIIAYFFTPVYTQVDESNQILGKRDNLGLMQAGLNLGNDTTYCASEDSIILGECMVISNTQGPLSYCWECLYSQANTGIQVTASVFLDDTAKQYPLLIGGVNGEWITFKMTVTDSCSNIASDSLNIRYSDFVYSTGFIESVINYGDSLGMIADLIDGGIQPLSYSWIPDTWLSDPNGFVTKCIPDSSIDYFLAVTDSVGCCSDTILGHRVTVLGNSIPKDKASHMYSMMGTRIEFSENIDKDIEIQIFDISGRILEHKKIFDNSIELKTLISNRGLYFVALIINNIYYNEIILI